MRRYSIVKHVEGLEAIRNPFRILESFPCADGQRTRIVNGTWNTLEEAQAYKNDLEARVYA